MRLCTMLRQASAEVGAVDGIVFISVCHNSGEIKKNFLS